MSNPDLNRGHERKLSHVQFVKKSQNIEDYESSDFSALNKYTDVSDITIDNIESQQNDSKVETWIECTHKIQHIGPFQRGNHCGVFSYLILVFLTVIFSGQLLLSREKTGEFFELHPFNYMLGPSSELMIKSGARFPPCMINIDAYPSDQVYVCSKTLLYNPDYRLPMHSLQFAPDSNLNSTCGLMSICSMTGFQQEKKPDQTFRFLTPLFVHAGIIPLFINNLFLIFIGIRIEKAMGSLFYSILFIGSGFFGQLLGCNLAPPTKIYLGCSSSILGLIGYLYVDLIYYWKEITKPISCLTKLVLLTGLTFCLGFIPWVDHFSNLGGFISGILLGLLLIQVQEPLLKRKALIIAQRSFAFLTYITLLIILIYRFLNYSIASIILRLEGGLRCLEDTES